MTADSVPNPRDVIAEAYDGLEGWATSTMAAEAALKYLADAGYLVVPSERVADNRVLEAVAQAIREPGQAYPDMFSWREVLAAERALDAAFMAFLAPYQQKED